MKRCIDVLASAVALAVLAPVLIAVGMVVRIALGRPVLFTQQRTGLHGATFTVRKFRTMTDARDGAGRPLPDAQRLGRIGRALRASSLDELPQLWNVLVGDMSLIGPRPLLPQYLDRYSAEQARRHEVRPGITGWAQVHGRNATTWDERLALDVWYVDHRSMRVDLGILWRTMRVVLSARGVSAKGSATMTEFTGGSAAGRTSTGL